MDSNSPIAIEAVGLSKFYGPFAAIRDVSFQAPTGQVAAFLGPNGAGKSTTMKILTGYLAPSAGRARIAGLDVQKDRIQAAEHVGYLPENGPLYPEMTPLELLRFFGRARGMTARRLKKRIDEVVDQTHLDEVLEKTIHKLSKGYRQRVGMAQALLHEPDILVMDEPTSGLDPNQIRDVRNLIRALAKTKTVLLSTHVLQEVEAICDRVILINEGRIVFDGAPQEMAGDEGLEEAFHRLTAGREASAVKAAEADAIEPEPKSQPVAAPPAHESPAKESQAEGQSREESEERPEAAPVAVEPKPAAKERSADTAAEAKESADQDPSKSAAELEAEVKERLADTAETTAAPAKKAEQPETGVAAEEPKESEAEPGVRKAEAAHETEEPKSEEAPAESADEPAKPESEPTEPKTETEERRADAGDEAAEPAKQEEMEEKKKEAAE